MPPFIKALEIVARVMRDGAAKQIMSGAPNNICASGGTVIRGPCVPCSDAVADGLNLTRAGVIRASVIRLPWTWNSLRMSAV
jgi:hypothetical protein